MLEPSRKGGCKLLSSVHLDPVNNTWIPTGRYVVAYKLFFLLGSVEHFILYGT
jgi:hypothetical protein